MKSIKLFGLLVVALTLSHETFAKSYKNHIVVTFTIENEEQLKEVQSLEMNSGVRQD